MCDFEVRLILDGYDSHDATVVEVELEETVRPVAAVEVASVVSDVIELVVHLGDAELLDEATVLVVLPELAKLDRRRRVIELAVETDRLLQVAGCCERRLLLPTVGVVARLLGGLGSQVPDEFAVTVIGHAQCLDKARFCVDVSNYFLS